MTEHRKWTQECDQPVELLTRLRAMPSSLNDALRTMEDAASFIERCGVQCADDTALTVIKEQLTGYDEQMQSADSDPALSESGLNNIIRELVAKKIALNRLLASLVSSAYRACQLCGEVAPLRCGPARFGAETWACDSCWNPQEASTHSPTEGK